VTKTLSLCAIILSLFLAAYFSSPVCASSWAQQQMQYNESAAQNDELFRQQEALEALRKDGKRDKEELRQKSEDLESQIRKLKEDNKISLEVQRQRDYSDQLARQMDEKLTLEQEQKKQASQQEYQGIVQRGRIAAVKSHIVLNNSFYERAAQVLQAKGFSLQQIDIINGLHKDYIYGIERDAINGNAEAQFKMVRLYLLGHPQEYDDIGRMKELLQEGFTDLSPARHKEVVVKIIKTTFANGKDIPYMVLIENYFLSKPKVKQANEAARRVVQADEDTASFWLETAAKHGHKTAIALVNKLSADHKGEPSKSLNDNLRETQPTTKSSATAKADHTSQVNSVSVKSIPIGLAFFYNDQGDMFTSKKLLNQCTTKTIQIKTSKGEIFNASIIAKSDKYDLAAISTGAHPEYFGSMSVSDDGNAHLPKPEDSIDLYSASYQKNETDDIEKKIGLGSVIKATSEDAVMTNVLMDIYPLSTGGIVLENSGLTIGMVPHDKPVTASFSKGIVRGNAITPMLNIRALISFANQNNLKINAWSKHDRMKPEDALIHADRVTGVVFCETMKQ